MHKTAPTTKKYLAQNVNRDYVRNYVRRFVKTLSTFNFTKLIGILHKIYNIWDIYYTLYEIYVI